MKNNLKNDMTRKNIGILKMKKIFLMFCFVLVLCCCGKRGPLDHPTKTVLKTTFDYDNDFGTTVPFGMRTYPKPHDPVVEYPENDLNTMQGLTLEALEE